MISNLINKLQSFTSRLDQGSKSTNGIINAIQNENWGAVEFETNNRARILNIIAMEQEKIEKLINGLIAEEINSESMALIKSWAFDTQNWISETADKDDQIIDMLNHSKDETTKEIAAMFKSKQAFRGYNLNDVRK